MTLFDLTHHEAGIIIYPDGGVAVLNWACCGDNSLPYTTSFGATIPWECEDGYLAPVECKHVDDLRTVLPGTVWLTADGGENRIVDTDLNIIADDNNDLPQLFLRENDPRALEANVYTLSDGTRIVAPDAWN